MRKLILVFSLLFCLTAFSQETYVYKGNGRVYDSKGVEVSPVQIRNLFSNNAKVLELYNAGRSKKTFGNILLYGGLGLGVGWFVYASTNEKNVKTTGYGAFGTPIIEQAEPVSVVPAIIGGALIIVAIPIKIGFSKKVKKSVDLMNENAPKQTVGFIESSTILVNQNGVGIALKF